VSDEAEKGIDVMSLSLAARDCEFGLNSTLDATSTLSCQSTTTNHIGRHPLCTSDHPANMDRNTTGSKQSFSRPSSVTSTNTTSTNKNRQYAHLHAQLAQLNAHLADTENLLRMTAVQAQDMRFLGGYVGALFMGSAKVLGEESVQGRGKQDTTKEA
jgi:hypothetical protein